MNTTSPTLYLAYKNCLGSKLSIFALFAFPSKTNSLINFPVAQLFWIPQHVWPVAMKRPLIPVSPIKGPPPLSTDGR
jgi:hypothetical protein